MATSSGITWRDSKFGNTILSSGTGQVVAQYCDFTESNSAFVTTLDFTATTSSYKFTSLPDINI